MDFLGVISFLLQRSIKVALDMKRLSKFKLGLCTIMLAACFLPYFSGLVSLAPAREASTVAIVPLAPRPADAPGSSDQSGDEWPMFHAALNHTSTVATAPVQGSGPTWNYTTGYQVYSSPAVAGGQVYVGSLDDKIYCLNATTGAKIWKYTTGGPVDSSPAIAGGYVYVGSGDNKTYCLNATTGTFVWSYTMGYWVYSSPVVAGGYVYVGSDDNKTYCLNATTGTFVWSYITGGGVESSPAVAGGRVYVGSYDKNIYCLNATTGAKIWSYATGNYVASSPAVAGGHVYVGSMDDEVYCLNAATGAFVWSYTTGNGVYYSSPAVAGGRVYVGSCDDKVYCLNAATGAFAWSYTTGNWVYFSSPAVAGGHVYVGSLDDKIYCLNATTGVLAWSCTTGNNVASSPAVAGGHVYVGSCDDKVYCLPMTCLSSAPQLFTAKAGNTQVVLSWAAPASNYGSAITNYKVYKGTTSGGEVLFATLGVALTYTITGLTNGQVYYFQVSAQNSNGEGARSAEVSATPMTAPTTVPGVTSPPNNTWLIEVAIIGGLVVVVAGVTQAKRRNKTRSRR